VGTIVIAGSVGVAGASAGAIVVAGSVGVAAGPYVDVAATVEVGMGGAVGVVAGTAQAFAITRMSNAARLVPNAICKVK